MHTHIGLHRAGSAGPICRHTLLGLRKVLCHAKRPRTCAGQSATGTGSASQKPANGHLARRVPACPQATPGAQKNRELRGYVWHQLQQAINATPARHMLLIAGDFNSTLKPDHPYVGPAAPPQDSHNNFDSTFQALLRDHRLTAANAWHARPSYTYVAPGTHSQIDYLLVRLQDAGRGARFSSPVLDFPVGAHRSTNHLPLQAPVLCPPAAKGPLGCCGLRRGGAASSCCRMHCPGQSPGRICKNRLRQQQCCPDLSAEHDAVNQILLEETGKFFPPAGYSDRRVSAHPEFRASARATWALRRRFKQSGLLLVRNVFDRLKHYAAFLRASKALRRQSFALKKQFLQDQISVAEQAAKQGDQRALFLVARKLAPRSHRGTIRLQNSEGKALSSQAAMQAIVAYSNATFAASPDTMPILPLQGTMDLGSHTFAQALSRLNVRKAVPSHCAPAAAWRLCSACISERLGPLLQRHFAADSQSRLVGDLRDANVVWLEKPNKPPTTVGALRPIGLMPSCAKAIAAALAQQIQAHIQPILDHMPQYAYCSGRGCSDAILRVHQHFEQVEGLQQSQASNRFRMKSGAKQLRCYGGMCLSLDLSKAFDSVCRDKLTQSLLDGISNDVISAVQQLHRSAKYVFRLDRETGHTLTTCGIKQGCRAAPALWTCLTLSIMESLVHRRSIEWLHRTLTAFADDFCGCWAITSACELLKAVKDLELILDILASFRLQVNFQKTALLISVKGKDAKATLNTLLVHKAGVPHLKVQVQGKEQLLKICESHTYLGTKLAYRNRRDLNVAHRISAAQTRYQQIRKVLNGRNPLSTKYRLRLWAACVNSSLLYSLEAVGCSLKGLRKLYTLATRHIRAILKLPAHLSRVTDVTIWDTAGLQPPEQHILQRMQKFSDSRDPSCSPHGPDLVNNSSVVQQIGALLSQHQVHLLRLAEERATTQADGSDQEFAVGVPCQHCGLELPTQHALRIHIGLKHKTQQRDDQPKMVTFSAQQHAVDGMPTCRLCQRSFTKWRQLKLHIERGSCPRLGGSSFLLSPPAPDNHLLPGRQQPTASTAQRQETPDASSEAVVENSAYLPLVHQPDFRSRIHNWEKLLVCRETKAQLLCRCVLCGMWVADPKHMKQHYNKTHDNSYPGLKEAATPLPLFQTAVHAQS